MDLGAWFQTFSFAMGRLKFLEDYKSKNSKNHCQESCKGYNIHREKNTGKQERQDQEL